MGVTEELVCTHYKYVWKTTIMLHFSSYQLQYSPRWPGAHGWGIESWLWYIMEIEEKELDEKRSGCWAILIEI